MGIYVHVDEFWWHSKGEGEVKKATLGDALKNIELHLVSRIIKKKKRNREKKMRKKKNMKEREKHIKYNYFIPPCVRPDRDLQTSGELSPTEVGNKVVVKR